MTTKQTILKLCIDNYPSVPNHLIHRAVPFKLNSDRRFRELRKAHGISVEYDRGSMVYKINTKKSELKKILKTIAA